jgi:type III secretion protein L
MVRLKAVGDAAPAPGTRVLKAREYELLGQASALLEDARREAQAVRDSAEAALEAERQRGYAEGTEQARGEAAERMLETVGRTVDYLGQVEDELIGVVMSAVRKLLGTHEDVDLIRRLAREALEVVRTQKRVTLRVAPALEEGVRERVADIVGGHGGISLLEIVGDPGLNAGGCVLESELGIVDASVDTQLAALERAMRARFGRGQSDG